MAEQKPVLVCDICGITSNEKIVRRTNSFQQFGNCFCAKHLGQLYRYGKIIDASGRTTNDKNEYILHDDYAEMILRSQNNKIDAIVKLDIEDVPRCMEHKWAISDRVDGKLKYARGRINGKNIRMHRFIMGYDGDLVVDHINRDTFDNRKSNLRIVPPEINDINKKSRKAYKQKNGKYRSYMKRDGSYVMLGTFDTEQEAVDAWEKKAEEIMNERLSKTSA